MASLFDERHLKVVYWHARKNAASRGIAFLLTPIELQQAWIRSGGRCELTGLPFDSLNPNGYRRRPFVASIDRIDNAQPYVASNIRLVVAAINLAINEWGEDVYRKIALAYLRRSKSSQRSECDSVSAS